MTDMEAACVLNTLLGSNSNADDALKIAIKALRTSPEQYIANLVIQGRGYWAITKLAEYLENLDHVKTAQLKEYIWREEKKKGRKK